MEENWVKGNSVMPACEMPGAAIACYSTHIVGLSAVNIHKFAKLGAGPETCDTGGRVA
jgi:hypothetical protein